MSQSDDMAAINRFMLSQQPATAPATKLRDEWIRWYEGLSWFDTDLDSAAYDEARNRRNAYNLANAVTTAQKAQVQQTIKTGLTTEQVKAPPGPTTNLEEYRRTTSTGTYITAPPPVIPTSYKIAAAAVGAAATVAFAYALPAALVSRKGGPSVSERISKFRRKVGARITGRE